MFWAQLAWLNRSGTRHFKPSFSSIANRIRSTKMNIRFVRVMFGAVALAVAVRAQEDAQPDATVAAKPLRFEQRDAPYDDHLLDNDLSVRDAESDAAVDDGQAQAWVPVKHDLVPLTYRNNVLWHHNIHRANHSVTALTWGESFLDLAAVLLLLTHD